MSDNTTGNVRHGQQVAGIEVTFDQTADGIISEVEVLIQQAAAVHDRVAAVQPNEISFETVIAPLAKLEAEQYALTQTIVFPKLVSTSKEVRDASSEAEKKLDAASVKLSMREDVYKVVKAYSLQNEVLDAESKRYVERLVRDYERNGLNLAPEVRKEVEELKTKIGELCITFDKNVNEENTILHFSEEELQGLPYDFIKNLEDSSDGKKKVTLKYPHYLPVMKQCKVSSTRQAMEVAMNRRCIDSNAPLLEEIGELRHKLAQLLGHATHSHYILDIRMAESPEKVKTFLEGVSEKVSPLAAKELDNLKQLKLAEEGTGELSMADFRYYMNKAEEVAFSIDHEKIREYFPLEVVTIGLMKIYQTLLGLIFTEESNPLTWHPDVQLYKVTDAETGEVMGYFYLDLFPRESKYGHACVCCLQPGYEKEDGSRQFPVAAMLCNFTKPTVEKPSLLTHREVETYFHEFGHVMHHMCARAKLSRFSGTRVERDFVEAPSQMLENWCWEKPSLQLMSGHYQDISVPIPDDLCQILMNTKKAHAGLLTKRQLLFGLFDQILHTEPRVDTQQILKEIHPKIMEGIPMTEGTNLGASFAHLTGGYDASYYGYMWSEVFSADMFASKFGSNVLDPVAGKEYREKILAPGGTRDAADLLRDFLGRDPQENAFLESKGLIVSS